MSCQSSDVESYMTDYKMKLKFTLHFSGIFSLRQSWELKTSSMKSKPILESIEFMILLICDSVSNCFYFFFTLKSTSSQIETKPETKPILEFIKFLISFSQMIKISFIWKLKKLKNVQSSTAKKILVKTKKHQSSALTQAEENSKNETDGVVFRGALWRRRRSSTVSS